MVKKKYFWIILISAYAYSSDCVLSEKLISDYEISFSGFKKDIPASPPPEKLLKKEAKNLLSISLAGEEQLPNDGYVHTFVFHKAKKIGWIYRTGGFIGTYEWYGPINFDTAELSGCRVSKYDIALTHIR